MTTLPVVTTITHPLATATTFHLALLVDTLLAERQLVQLHHSLASHMGLPGNTVEIWLEARLGEIDANIVDIVRLAADRDHDADGVDHLAAMKARAGRVLDENPALPDIGKLIAEHRRARANHSAVADGETMTAEDEAAADRALEDAERALFAFRPATADQASTRATYLLDNQAHDFLHVSLWDESDVRAVVGSMVRSA